MMDLTDEDSLDWMARGRRGATAESTDVDDSTDHDVHVNDTFGTKDAVAATRYSEGDKVRLDDQRGVVVEVRTEPFEGPDGDDWDASDDSPVYVVGTVDGAEAARASDLTMDDWSSGKDDPDGELADSMTGGAEGELAASMEAFLTSLPPGFDAREQGTLTAGVTDWDYPESWTESDVPARLILLDAWSSMGGQFDCGGGCCKGTMLSSGMSDRASDQFCASMKDRVLMWEGWRQGG